MESNKSYLANHWRLRFDPARLIREGLPVDIKNIKKAGFDPENLPYLCMIGRFDMRSEDSDHLSLYIQPENEGIMFYVGHMEIREGDQIERMLDEKVCASFLMNINIWSSLGEWYESQGVIDLKEEPFYPLPEADHLKGHTIASLDLLLDAPAVFNSGIAKDVSAIKAAQLKFDEIHPIEVISLPDLSDDDPDVLELRLFAKYEGSNNFIEVEKRIPFEEEDFSDAADALNKSIPELAETGIDWMGLRLYLDMQEAYDCEGCCCENCDNKIHITENTSFSASLDLELLHQSGVEVNVDEMEKNGLSFDELPKLKVIGIIEEGETGTQDLNFFYTLEGCGDLRHSFGIGIFDTENAGNVFSSFLPDVIKDLDWEYLGGLF